MTTKRSKFIAPEVSDPQGPAHSGGIVPAPLASSSCKGLEEEVSMCTAVKEILKERQRYRQEEEGAKGGTEFLRELKEGEDVERYREEIRGTISLILRPPGQEKEHDLCHWDEFLLSPTEGEAHFASHLSKMLSAGELLRMGDNWPQLHQEVRFAATKLASVCRGAFEMIDQLQTDVEALEHELALRSRYFRGMTVQEELVKEENKRLREECKRLRAETRSPSSPAVERRTIGVQTVLSPIEKERRSVGVQSDLPSTNRGSQTSRKESIGAGGGTWSADRVAALIDAKMTNLRNEIVAEVCGGAGGCVSPARKKRVSPPSSGPGLLVSGRGAVVPGIGEEGEEEDKGGSPARSSAVAAWLRRVAGRDRWDGKGGGAQASFS